MLELAHTQLEVSVGGSGALIEVRPLIRAIVSHFQEELAESVLGSNQVEAPKQDVFLLVLREKVK